MEKNEIIETLRANRTLLEQFHIRSLSVFGSIVRGEAGPDSDVDILVEFDPGANVDGPVKSRKSDSFVKSPSSRRANLEE